jgi:diacylglycerol kinase family enzyme
MQAFPADERDKVIFRVSEFPRHGLMIVRRFALEHRNEPLRVYAVGGDGILFDCLNGIEDMPHASLATVPYGSSNDFQRAFGEGKEIKSRFQNVIDLKKGNLLHTDLIKADKNYAINLCTIGIEAEAVRIAARISRFIKAFPFYRRIVGFTFKIGGAIAIIQNRYTYHYYEIIVDGVDYSGIYGNVNISNGPCSGGSVVTNVYADPTDGLLDLILVPTEGVPITKCIQVVVDYTSGRLEKCGDMIVRLRFKEMVIRSNDTLLFNLDGEVFAGRTLTVSVARRGIKIIDPIGEGYCIRAT